MQMPGTPDIIEILSIDISIIISQKKLPSLVTVVLTMYNRGEEKILRRIRTIHPCTQFRE